MKKYGLIGFPLGHSFSKSYFADKFRKENITDIEYNNYPIEDVLDFEKLHKEDPEIFGLNVTIPYKESIVKHLDVLSEAARDIQAVNTICLCRKTGHLARVGHNTDVIGFEKSLLENLTDTPKRALVLGTGGSSKAVVYVLKKMGIDLLRLSRTEKEGVITYEELTKEIIESAQLIVNTTPLGMHPKVELFPSIPYKYLSKKHLLFDLVYNPKETVFLKKGKEAGARVVNGSKMLKYQAEASWEIWNKK